MPFTNLSIENQKILLQTARHSIEFGLTAGNPPSVDLNQFPETLRKNGCSFVTLTKAGQLRGCIGALSAYQALIQDVTEHAYAAAFEDHRFGAINSHELPLLHIEISVLTPQVPIQCNDEQDLLDQLEPNKDGIALEDNHYRATFLPAVWEKLPDRRDFLQELKRKAGMPAEYWSPSTKVYRYHTISFSE